MREEAAEIVGAASRAPTVVRFYDAGGCVMASAPLVLKGDRFSGQATVTRSGRAIRADMLCGDTTVPIDLTPNHLVCVAGGMIDFEVETFRLAPLGWTADAPPEPASPETWRDRPAML